MAAPLQVPLDSVRADYNIYRYTDEVYKVVKFRSVAPRVGILHEKDNHYDYKLDASLSRARRVVLELALCNEWSYFCTFTISKSKFDRTDLDAWYKAFNQFIRDTRKKSGLDIRYVLVPEKHADGSWHMHGMFSDISPLLTSFADLLTAGENVPLDLVRGGAVAARSALQMSWESTLRLYVTISVVSTLRQRLVQVSTLSRALMVAL